MLTEIEDSLLAMSEEEPVQQKVAVQVLSCWYGRPVSSQEVTQIACHLANLGFVRWVYLRRGKWYLSKRVQPIIRRLSKSSLLATDKGQAELHKTKM